MTADWSETVGHRHRMVPVSRDLHDWPGDVRTVWRCTRCPHVALEPSQSFVPAPWVEAVLGASAALWRASVDVFGRRLWGRVVIAVAVTVLVVAASGPR